jgi:hypothetical protein
LGAEAGAAINVRARLEALARVIADHELGKRWAATIPAGAWAEGIRRALLP